MELLEVRNLSKEYKTFLLDNISFTLSKGYIMGYVGQNGAGKSTTLNLITNICKSSSGEIYVDGITCEEDESRYKESIGYIGDEFYFPDNFRIRDVRSVLRNFYKTFRTEKFDELTKRWKLDEATNGLDPVVRVEVLKLLQEYIADGERSVIFSTHILSDLEQIADYIYFIHEGKTVLYDAKDELLESHLLVKGERRAIYPELQRALIGIMDNAYGFEAILPSDRADLLTNEFHFEKPTIDQIVIHYIREREG